MKSTSAASCSSSSSSIIHTLVLLLVFGLFCFANSQSSDSCDSSFNLNGLVSFETTSLKCHVVWDAQGYILRYRQNTTIWSFVLSAPNTNSFVGIGFSRDGRMAGSSAVVGWVPPSNGIGVIKQYFLGATNPNQVIPDQGNLPIVNNSMAIVSQSSRLFLSFQLNTTQPESRLLYSVGPRDILPSSTNFRLTEHRDKIATRLNFESGQSSASQRPYTRLRRSHGILNMLGWGIFILIGAMCARYLRDWDPIWFYSHTFIQLFSFTIGATGVIVGFVLENVLSAEVDRHKTIGILVLILGCLQVMAVLLRPGKDSKVRKYWNWYHRCVGGTLIILSVSNVFYGIHVGDEDNSWNIGYGVVFAMLGLAVIILEVRLWRRRKC